MIKQYYQENQIQSNFKALIEYISHDEFVSVNNVLKLCNEVEEEIKNPETSVKCII